MDQAWQLNLRRSSSQRYYLCYYYCSQDIFIFKEMTSRKKKDYILQLLQRLCHGTFFGQMIFNIS